jgi:hypothetical protein
MVVEIRLVELLKMPDKPYAHRTVTQKLGIIPGVYVAIDDTLKLLGAHLLREVQQASGRPLGDGNCSPDVVLATIDSEADPAAVLTTWRLRIVPTGVIWLVTPKRSQRGYVPQDALIPMGRLAGMVDNKVCSVSDTLSAMRFVIPVINRPR